MLNTKEQGEQPQKQDAIYSVLRDVYKLMDVYGAPMDNPPQGTIEDAWPKMEKILERLEYNASLAIMDHESMKTRLYMLEHPPTPEQLADLPY